MIMKMIFAVSVLLISGCASVIDKKPDESALEQQPEIVAPDAADISEKLELKRSAFEPEVLYLLLTAELAGQKGQYRVALEGYLRAARLVNDPRISERAVKVALFLKDYPKAGEAIELWLANDSDDLMARKVAAMLALMNEDKDAAIDHLNFLLTTDPAGFESSLLEIVKSLEREGKGELVFDVLEYLSIIHPEQTAILFVQSLLSMQQNNSEMALQKVQKALAIQPDWNKALLLQSQIVAGLGDTERAESILREAIEKRPENVKLKEILARVLIKATKFEEAVEVFQQVLEQEPEDLDSQYALALLYLQVERDDKAKKIFLSLLDQPGWDDKASFHLGRLDVAGGDFKRARVWFDKITRGPYLFDAKIATVGLLLDQKQYSEAEQFLGQLNFENQSQELRVVLIKAELWGKQSRYQEAYDLLTATLQTMPEQKELLYTRALIAEHLGFLDVAEGDLKAILEKHPDDASALNALGYTLADRGERLEQAEIYLNRALEIEPDDPVIIDSYGWLLFRQGQYEKALEYLQKAYDQEQEAEIAGHLVEVLWQLGRQQEAREVYRGALQKAGDDEYLLRLKQQIKGLSAD